MTGELLNWVADTHSSRQPQVLSPHKGCTSTNGDTFFFVVALVVIVSTALRQARGGLQAVVARYNSLYQGACNLHGPIKVVLWHLATTQGLGLGHMPLFGPRLRAMDAP